MSRAPTELPRVAPAIRVATAVALAVVAVLAADAGAENAIEGRDRPLARTILAGTSLEERPIHGYVVGDVAPVVLFVGGVHGNEPATAPLLDELVTYLAETPGALGSHRAVVVPRANPDGLAAEDRFNANDVDINRNFPAQNFTPGRHYGDGPLSEPETRALHGLIHRYRPVRIVAVHQPYGTIDYDGPAKDLAEAMARHVDHGVERVGARPGSLGSYAGEHLDIPTVTLELPDDASDLAAAALWEAYGPALLEALD